MSEKWFFELHEGAVYLRARAESTDGSIVGDAFREVRRGESFCGLTYNTLARRRAGVVEVDMHGHGSII